MLFLIFLICFSPNFLLIRSEGQDLVISQAVGKHCTLESSYTFSEGQNVSFSIKWSGKKILIKHGWWKLKDSQIYVNFTESHIMVAEKYMAGVWMFEFLYLQDVKDLFVKGYPYRTYENHNYTQSLCETNVTIETPGHLEIKQVNYIIILSVVLGIALTIIIAQAAYIVYLNTKAKKLDRHNNLSLNFHKEPAEIDTTRYCSDPGKMIAKAQPSPDMNRKSIIYEAPNIELRDRVPIIQPTTPPQPPAITTMPRTPRLDPHSRIHQPMLAAALNSPTRTHNEQLTLPRSKPTERELNVANRPPLPLPNPHQDVQYEVYEEMETDDNTYEPPPINMLPPKHNVPQKKAEIPPKSVDIQRDPQKMRCVNKPAVTPKPQRPPSALQPTTNELEQAFKRRNNVLQVPITSIPDPSRSGTTPPKLNPPPVMKSKPRAPPTVAAPVPEETYYSYSNDRQDSSDEEWTYEPLKPLNSYNDNANIYNI